MVTFLLMLVTFMLMLVRLTLELILNSWQIFLIRVLLLFTLLYLFLSITSCCRFLSSCAWRSCCTSRFTVCRLILPVSGVFIRTASISAPSSCSRRTILVPDIISIAGNKLIFRLWVLIQFHEFIMPPFFCHISLPHSFGWFCLLLFILFFFFVSTKPVIMLIEHPLLRNILRILLIIIIIHSLLSLFSLFSLLSFIISRELTS